MTTVRFDDLNENNRITFKEIVKTLSDKFHEDLNLDKTLDLPIDKESELKSIAEQIALAFYDGRGDVLNDIMYATDGENKRLRGIEEMKQMRLGYAQRFEMKLFDSFDNPEPEKLFLARLMYTNKYNDIESFATLPLEDFKSVANAFVNGYTKEEINEKLQNGTLEAPENKKLGDLIDEYGSTNVDENFELEDDLDSFIV